MIEAYKHIKGTYSVDTPSMKLEDTGSRGHEFKLKKERAAKAVHLNFFSLRINTTWNSLPSHIESCDIVDAPSINSKFNLIKVRLDKYRTTIAKPKV